MASGGRERERSGTRWFARASNTSLNVSPGSGVGSTRPNREARLPARHRGWLGFSWREWFRGSAKDRRRHQRDAPTSNPLPDLQPVSALKHRQPGFGIGTRRGVSTATLRAMVLAQIPTIGETAKPNSANCVKHSDGQQRSLRTLFLGLGYAKSESMNTLLEHLLKGQAMFRDEGTVRYWSKQTLPQPPLEERRQTVQRLFRPHLSSKDFMPMSTLLGRVKYY